MGKTIRLSSDLLLDKLKEFEGLRLEAYKCPGGVLTIGYGHTWGVKPGDKISEYWAEHYLRKDVWHVEQELLKLGIFKYNGQDGFLRYQGQLDALVSFVFNIGMTKFTQSTLYDRLRRRAPKEVIVEEWHRWCYANGKKLKGLSARRNWETVRFYDATDTLDEVREAVMRSKFGDELENGNDNEKENQNEEG